MSAFDGETRIRGLQGDQTLGDATAPGLLEADPTADTWIRTPAREEATATLSRLPILPVGGEADLVVEAVLGTGGMGVVHLARQRSLQREVALKRLGRNDPALVEGLLREAMVTGSLEHPNIVPVHALGRDQEGEPVLVMKRVEGRKWSSLVREDFPLDDAALERHLRILLDVCNALQYAHSRGVVHRDVKLGNVMVGGFGEVYLLDWGIAAPVGTVVAPMVGTPGYMAPEMVEGGPVSERTDIYLLGATLHHLLVGKARHHADDVQIAMRSAWESAPYDYAVAVPAELAAICHRAMHRDPARRYATVLELQRAVQDYLQHKSSLQQGRNAAARLGELFALLSDTKADGRRVADLLGACRYGLREALAAWPDNPSARSEMVRLLERSIPYALDQGDAEGAKEQLDELIALAPDPGRYAHLQETVGHEVRKHEALVRLGHELDLSVSGPQRLRFLVGMWVVATVFGGAMVGSVRWGFVQVTHFAGVWVAIGAVTGLQLALLWAPRRYLANVADKRILYSMIIGAWGVLVHRLFGWVVGMEPEQVYAQDLTLLAFGASILGVTVSRRLLFVCALLVIAAAYAALVPHRSIEAIASALSASCLLMVVLFRQWAR